MDDTDLNAVLALIRDRFDSLDRRLDQQRGAMELWASSINRHATKLAKHQTRIQKLEEAFRDRRRGAERKENAVQQRLGRWTTIFSGLLGGLVAYGLVLLTGAH